MTYYNQQSPVKNISTIKRVDSLFAGFFNPPPAKAIPLPHAIREKNAADKERFNPEAKQPSSILVLIQQ